MLTPFENWETCFSHNYVYMSASCYLRSSNYFKWVSAIYFLYPWIKARLWLSVFLNLWLRSDNESRIVSIWPAFIKNYLKFSKDLSMRNYSFLRSGSSLNTNYVFFVALMGISVYYTITVLSINWLVHSFEKKLVRGFTTSIVSESMLSCDRRNWWLF